MSSKPAQIISVVSPNDEEKSSTPLEEKRDAEHASTENSSRCNTVSYILITLVVGIPIFLIFMLHSLLYIVHKLLGYFALSANDCIKCSANDIDRRSSIACAPCFRGLIYIISYIFYYIFVSISYGFYIASLMFLRVLAFISSTYEDEYATSKFSLKFEELPEEQQQVSPQPSNTSINV
jgi:hypothetical protein